MLRNDLDEQIEEIQEPLLVKNQVYRPYKIVKWSKNIWRTLVSPLTQTLMAVGIFPAQTLSTVKKVPVLSSIIGFITRKTGNDSRPAWKTFIQDFVHKTPQTVKRGFFGQIWNFFNVNPKAKPHASNLWHYYEKVPYKTDFNRNVTLETFGFQSVQFNSLPDDQKYYRLHCGNNTANCSRFFTELSTLSERHPELKTITYNHPGVESSGGMTMSKDDLVNALYAQVKHLIQNGAKPENIELSGFSIGAATAVLTAAKLKKEGINIKLADEEYNQKIEVGAYGDRTFSSMSDVVTNGFPVLGTVFKAMKSAPLLKELSQYVLQPLVKNIVVKPLLWLTNWDMKPAKKFKTLAPEQRQATTVKPQSKGEGVLKTIGKYFSKFGSFLSFKKKNGDQVIPHHVSLVTASEDENTTVKFKRKVRELEDHIEHHHGRIADASILEDIPCDNSISSDALVRLKLAAGKGEMVADLVSLMKVGLKARRFAGVDEKDAHNNRSEELSCRVKQADWEGALRASDLDPQLPTNGVSFYSLHHKAIKNRNERAQGKATFVRAVIQEQDPDPQAEHEQAINSPAKP